MPKKAFSKTGNIAIFVYWSRSKALETNSISYVRELVNVSELVLFVSNSQLGSKDVSKLMEIGATFLQRDNFGFDFWGWKEGIRLLEDKIKKAKTLILCNSSCFLAFDSLGPLLSSMDNEADLWGVSSFENISTPFHIQSYFLLFKKTILQDWKSFITFWDKLPQMPGWEEAVKLGEIKLTQFYLDRGFKCKAIASPNSLPSEDVNPSFYYPTYLLEKGSPLLKKKIFFESYQLYFFTSYGDTPRKSMSYIREKGGRYNEILSELIKTSTPSQLIQTLHLNYIVGTRQAKEQTFPQTRVALICFVYYEDMVEYFSNILTRFNHIADVYIISSKNEVLELYKNKLDNKLVEIEYRLQQNRGRNEAAYFITCQDVWKKYKYICALHDKKTSHAKPALQGIDFMRHCEQNLCPSESSILEIVEFFDKNPLLGLLVPPLPFFGTFISSVYHPLGRNKKSLRLLNEKLFAGKLFSPGKLDVFSAPFGGMFWARTEAFTSLSHLPLSFKDFPKEPLSSSDGTLLHAVERCYPMVAKSAGFYTARVINVSFLPVLYDNLIYFCVHLPDKERFLFAIKNILKQRLSSSPFLYNAIRKLVIKITCR